MTRLLAKWILETAGLLPAARHSYQALLRTYQGLQYRVKCVRYRADAGGFPIPPLSLNRLVTGTSDVEWYVKGGWLAALSIRLALERNAINLNDLTSILDFGCGSGRVIRYWHNLPAALYGADYNPDLLRWCERHLPFAKFQVNGSVPPLGYPRDSFDLRLFVEVSG
jgi:SAM-dependent methyltransferase